MKDIWEKVQQRVKPFDTKAIMIATTTPQERNKVSYHTIKNNNLKGSK